MQFPDLSVALMAGGKSVRMGTDKARLVGRGGRELWEDRLDLLSGLGAGEVMISVRDDQTALRREGVRPVVDGWAGQGPLGGIVSCLEAMGTDYLLVMAVDLPAMNRSVLEDLVDRSRKEGRGVVCRVGGFLEPLVGVYPKAMALSGRRRLEAGDLALRGWIADGEAAGQMEIMDAPEEWSGFFVNVNDPAAWAAWMAQESMAG